MTGRRSAHRWMVLAVIVAGALSAGCAQGPANVPPGTAPSAAASRPSPAPTLQSPTPVQAVFHGTVDRIDDATRARMSSSWHEGCPVGLDDLRLLHLSYWDFHGQARMGEMVVNADVADDVVAVFRRLFRSKFPIERMRLVDAYGGDDDRSMAADNTSAFNCRFATGHPGVWSEHSFGRAIDINPLRNPYVASDGSVLPKEGTPYADRNRSEPGMIHDGDAVVWAFAAIGWGWGGHWTSFQDYQHFSQSGR